MCKDTLMQAAGRMRQLGKRQTLEMVCLPELADNFCRPSVAGEAVGDPAVARQRRAEVCSVLAVLQWVMGNTVAVTEAGLLPWATQGLHFAASYGRPERAVQDKLLDLEDMYGSGKAPQLVGEVVGSMVRAEWGTSNSTGGGGGSSSVIRIERTDTGDAHQMQLVRGIESRARSYGRGYYVVAGSTAGDEECERELEQEVERQLPAMQPRADVDWEYGEVLGASSVAELGQRAAGLQCVHLGTVAESLGLGAIPWSARVYCTANFMRTVGGSAAAAAAGQCLRPVDAVLLFKKGRGGRSGSSGAAGADSSDGGAGGAGDEVLLISEREADRLLDAMRQAVRDCCRCYVELTNIEAWTDDGWEYPFRAFESLMGPTLTSVVYLNAAAAAAANRSESPETEGGGPKAAAASDGSWCDSRVRLAIGGPADARGGLVTVPDDAAMVCVRLFNGEASYARGWQQAVLRGLVAGRRAEVEALVGRRGR